MQIAFWILLIFFILNSIEIPILIHFYMKEHKKRILLESHLNWISEHNGTDIKIEKDDNGDINKISSTRNFVI